MSIAEKEREVHVLVLSYRKFINPRVSLIL